MGSITFSENVPAAIDLPKIRKTSKYNCLFNCIKSNSTMATLLRTGKIFQEIQIIGPNRSNTFINSSIPIS